MDIMQIVSANQYIILAIFVIVVILLYKVFQAGIKAIIAGAAGFAFPWVAQYIGLPVTPSIGMALQFALLAIGLFLAYEFFHIIMAIIKVITWPFRMLLGRKK